MKWCSLFLNHNNKFFFVFLVLFYLHDEMKMFVVLISLVELNNIWMVQTLENFKFPFEKMQVLFDFLLWDRFYCEFLGFVLHKTSKSDSAVVSMT